jgi:hypothetical protein
MAATKNLVSDILDDIDEGLLSLEQIAEKHEVSRREVQELAFVGDVLGTFFYDELEREHDEPFEPEYPDPDSSYENQYDLGDY